MKLLSKLPTALPIWMRGPGHALRAQPSRRPEALPEIDEVLTLLRAAGAPTQKLEDRVLTRLRVEHAGTVSPRSRAGGKGFGRDGRSLLNLGLASGTVCLLCVLILSHGVHRKQGAAADRLQPAPGGHLAVPFLEKEGRAAVSSANAPTLGLAAARREPPRQIATGSRSGRVNTRLRRQARRTPAP